MKLLRQKSKGDQVWEMLDVDYFPVSKAYLLVFSVYQDMNEERKALDIRLWKRRNQDTYVATKKGIRAYSQSVIERIIEFFQEKKHLLPELMPYEEKDGGEFPLATENDFAKVFRKNPDLDDK